MMMDYDHLSPTGSRSPLASSNSSCPDRNPTPTTADDDLHIQRPPRACEYCRQHKVRCDIDLRDPSGTCGRCQKAGRECVSSSYSRKRRKTTDSRVLDLEKKVEKLTSRLDELERKGGGEDQGRDKQTTEVGSFSDRYSGESGSHITPVVFVEPPNNPDATPIQQDVIDRQIVSVELAGRMFQHYVTNLATIFPAVVFPPDTPSSDIRRQRPVLFLSVLTAASAEFDSSLQRKLHSELLKCFSDQIIHRGIKTLELVQALTVSVLWHRPPETVGGNNLNQFIHMAAIMAHDIAITKSNASKRYPGGSDPATAAKVEQQWKEHFPMGTGWRFMIWGFNPDSSLPESRRALLSCYFMCSNIARLTRRPNIFPFTSYISECIEFLETSNEPGVYASDRNLVQWIKLSRVAEQFGVVPPPGESVADLSASELHAKIALEGFLEQIAEWRRTATAAGVITPALSLFACGAAKHMYDLILYSEHIAEEFRPLAFETLIAHAQQEPNRKKPTKFHVDAVRACLVTLHSFFEDFLALSPGFARSLPGIFYIEIGYAIGILVKILFAALLSSPANRILDVGQVKFTEYVDRFIVFLAEVTTRERRFAAKRLREIIMGLKSFVEKHRQKAIEAVVVASKSNVQSFERTGVAANTPASPLPPLTPQQSYLPSPGGGMDSGLPFVSYPDVSRSEVGYTTSGLQGIDSTDSMMWEGFPLTEFLQLDGAPGLYPPWG